ncbi:MAG: hypothetical protein KME01_01975 [Chroococcus sp. CMT-3BRIN-NPC107]|jgi:ABC-type transporter Mla subunit MlaD|nr:hypothetical protein [Chroococcus sp. CMT-3BRIN-NPC107]
MATADLNSTISALKGGLTSLPAEAAVANIESWHSQLKDAAPEVASTLAELKTALTSGSASGSSIGALLKKLGEQASGAGASAGGDAGSQLQELGKMLTSAGGSL